MVLFLKSWLDGEFCQILFLPSLRRLYVTFLLYSVNVMNYIGFLNVKATFYSWNLGCIDPFIYIFGLIGWYLVKNYYIMLMREISIWFALLYVCHILFWPHKMHWEVFHFFVAAGGLSLVAASGGYSSLRCVGFSLRWLLLLWSMGSRCMGFSSCGARAQ